MFEKILVPVDGSKHSNKALRYATMLAEKFHSKIILVHVYSSPIGRTIEPAMGASSITQTDMNAIQQQGKQILEHAKTEVEKAKKNKTHILVETYLKQGDIVEQISSTAKKEKADIIVMGARGISKLKECLLGSTSDGVSRNALCPVMIVK